MEGRVLEWKEGCLDKLVLEWKEGRVLEWKEGCVDIDVVTFCLHGWCMLGVFLLDVRMFGVRVMECICAQTRPRCILSPERVLGEGSQNPC